MTKKIKSLAVAALAVSALVPVASVSANEVTTFDSVVVSIDGKNVEFTQLQYNSYITRADSYPTITHIKVAGKFYSLAQYNSALTNNSGNYSTTFAALSTNPNNVSLDVVEGTLKDGQLVPADPTPEEKINETFFYNLAA